MMILLKKKDTMNDQEFAKYWLEKHAPLAKKMPGLRKYVVNVVRPHLTGSRITTGSWNCGSMILTV